MNTETLEAAIKNAAVKLEACRNEIGKRLIGQRGMIDGLLMGILSGGHVLLEGVPGLAKTLAVKTLSEIIDTEFKRIQFTPDLLPADLIGTMIFRPGSGDFVARKGPVFTNILLADEINRAPAKVQSALLEAMAEKQVTIGTHSYQLPNPFFVLATQNPIEQEGTYPLPEAQLDRFIMKLKIGYLTPQEELAILKRMGTDQEIPVEKVLTAGDIAQIMAVADSILVDERIEQYIVSLITASREQDKLSHTHAKFIEYGASTRATLSLYRCAKIKALFEGRSFVIPDDVKAVVYPVLRHRIVLSYEAESENLSADDVIDKILKLVPVP